MAAGHTAKIRANRANSQPVPLHLFPDPIIMYKYPGSCLVSYQNDSYVVGTMGLQSPLSTQIDRGWELAKCPTVVPDLKYDGKDAQFPVIIDNCKEG